MKKIIFAVTVFSICLIHNHFIHGEEIKIADIIKMAGQINWMGGQASVKINAGGKVIYIDPYQLSKPDKADIILITHSHGDHLSTQNIEKVLTDQSTLIAPQDCFKEFKKNWKAKVLSLAPGQNMNIDGILIEAVPAYNIVKTNFHPKANNWVGYILTIDKIRIYHTGDTERIPEMKNMACDIILLPLGQTYTMNSVEEAAEATLDVKAKIAIPIHFGLYEGKAEDAQKFQALLKVKVKVIIKQKQ
jgi:L-ascorbate metabolism protein UlaG (beta-lactamase superfamily)